LQWVLVVDTATELMEELTMCLGFDIDETAEKYEDEGSLAHDRRCHCPLRDSKICNVARRYPTLVHAEKK